MRQLARPLAAVGNDVAHQARIVEVYLRALAHRLLFLEDGLDYRLFALQTADAGAAASLLHPVLDSIIRINFVEFPHRAFFRIAGIGAPDARRVRRHGANFFRYAVRVLPQGDGVIVGLRHFLSVQARHAGRLRQQGTGFGQDHLSAPFQETEQAFTIPHGQVGRFLEQRFGRRQRPFIALLLVAGAQLAVELAALDADFLDRQLGLLLEAGFTAVNMVEAPRYFAREFNVRHLILTHRDAVGAVYQDIGALQEGVAKEAVGRQVLFSELLLLVLVGRHPLEPAQRRDHGQQKVQLRVLRHARLDEQGRLRRVNAGGKPVHQHVPNVVFNNFWGIVVSGQRVPVRDEKQALVFMLQPDPIFEYAMVVAKMQASGGAHTRQHTINEH